MTRTLWNQPAMKENLRHHCVDKPAYWWRRLRALTAHSGIIRRHPTGTKRAHRRNAGSRSTPTGWRWRRVSRLHNNEESRKTHAGRACPLTAAEFDTAGSSLFRGFHDDRFQIAIQRPRKDLFRASRPRQAHCCRCDLRSSRECLNQAALNHRGPSSLEPGVTAPRGDGFPEYLIPRPGCRPRHAIFSRSRTPGFTWSTSSTR